MRFSPSTMKTMYKNYFKVHFFLLTCLGIELKPMKGSTAIFFYKIYTIMIFAVVFVNFPFSEILSLVYEENFESAIYNLAFLLTQILGELNLIHKYIFLLVHLP